MLTLQVIACIGIITGAFLLFQIRLNDFTGNIFHRLLDAPKGIREEILEETKRQEKILFPQGDRGSTGNFENNGQGGAVPAFMHGIPSAVCRRSSHCGHDRKCFSGSGAGMRIFISAVLVHQADRIPFQKGCVIGTGNRTVYYYNGVSAQ